MNATDAAIELVELRLTGSPITAVRLRCNCLYTVRAASALEFPAKWASESFKFTLGVRLGGTSCKVPHEAVEGSDVCVIHRDYFRE